jgi:hypothetical protein
MEQVGWRVNNLNLKKPIRKQGVLMIIVTSLSGDYLTKNIEVHDKL